MADLARSNALVVLGEDVTQVAEGEDVDVWLLDEVY
jgi:molybdopterin biosynthesis enzyme